MLEYEQRDMVLAKMGFASYPEYLASKLWQKIQRCFKQEPMKPKGRNASCLDCWGIAYRICES